MSLGDTHYTAILLESADIECSICCLGVACMVILPCGHGGICEGCAKAIIAKSCKCYLCRRKVEVLAKISCPYIKDKYPTEILTPMTANACIIGSNNVHNINNTNFINDDDLDSSSIGSSRPTWIQSSSIDGI